ncbi:transporter substrate-binding domain-containing protein [Pseudodesulfovibrio sp.]|uniref:transporter substrate-binding domain-containing protein n=1 Tax=unclassified Pseudodesulfovibrio TaxID=2661612 RepID=UPI003B00362F
MLSVRHHILFFTLIAAILLGGRPCDAALPEWDGNRPLVIVHSRNMPPLSYIGTYGEPKGLIVDYWKLWAKVNGLPIKIVLVDWPETLRMIKDGEADIHGGMFYTKARAQLFSFAPSFVEMDSAVTVRKDSPVKSMDDLKGTAVGVLDRGYAAQYLSDFYPHIVQKPYIGSAQIVRGALHGEIDAFLTERVTQVHLLGEEGKLDDFRMLEVLYTREIQPVVSKGNEKMLEVVKRGMDAIPRHELDRTFRRWTIPSSSIPPWLIVVAAISIIILAGGVLVFMLPSGRR